MSCLRVGLSHSVNVVGAVTCLEEGCGKATIQLTRNEKLPDGGLKSGFGTLSAYRVSFSFFLNPIH